MALMLDPRCVSLDCIKEYRGRASLASTKELVRKYQNDLISKLQDIHKHVHKPHVNETQGQTFLSLYDDDISREELKKSSL